MDLLGTDLTDFLDRYVATLEAFDAPAAADLWSLPGTIVDDRFTGVVSTREEMVAGLEQSYPLYRQLGLASVDHELLEVRRLSDALVQVQVRWLFRDAAGELLTDSHPSYVLRWDEGGFRACVCVQTDDLEKLRDLAARVGIDVPAA